MARIDKASLYAIQVQTPPGLNDLLGTILPNGRFQSGTDFMPDRLVPCLIYKEWISGIDGASLLPFSRRVIVARTNHNGLQGNLQHSVDRDILSLSSKGMSDLNRGKILVAFCEIEFIVDILICHKLGVYSGENTYENVKKEYFSEEGDLATFEKKREFLLQENIITKNISSELQKAQRIRNSVAHNYFLDKNMGRPSRTMGQSSRRLN